MSESTFKPAWWLPGPHLQTIWQTFFRGKVKEYPLTRERVELHDGDFIDLDWIGHEKEKKGPIVLILHGLEGSIESPYATGMLAAIHRAGWRGVFMHFRGCSEELNRMPRSYHSGDTDDVAAIVEALKMREPETQIAAIGFSLGGNVLLKWLGESGSENPLSAAVAISVPFELQKASKKLERGLSRLYNWYLLRALRTKTYLKFQWRATPFDRRVLAKLKTLHDFDDHVTAPMHGFSSADHYYAVSSSRQYLKNIVVPTLIIQSEDDPFMTKDVIPQPEELPSNVELEVTTAGGHVGFVSGNVPGRAEYWLEKRVPAYLHTFLNGKQKEVLDESLSRKAL